MDDDLNQVDFTFNWTQEMSVGSERLDNQHKQLLEEVNTLLSAMINNESPSVLLSTISFLDEYTSGHLVDEEEYMQSYNYPEFEVHKKMHENFVIKYDEIKGKLESEGASKHLISEVQTYIGEWWMQHIAKEDKKYAEYIGANK